MAFILPFHNMYSFYTTAKIENCLVVYWYHVGVVVVRSRRRRRRRRPKTFGFRTLNFSKSK